MTLRSRFGQVTPIEMHATLTDSDPAAYGRRILLLADGRALTVPAAGDWEILDATAEELAELDASRYARLARGGGA
jgi:hypothetical protein